MRRGNKSCCSSLKPKVKVKVNKRLTTLHSKVAPPKPHTVSIQPSFFSCRSSLCLVSSFHCVLSLFHFSRLPDSLLEPVQPHPCLTVSFPPSQIKNHRLPHCKPLPHRQSSAVGFPASLCPACWPFFCVKMSSFLLATPLNLHSVCAQTTTSVNLLSGGVR